MRYEAVHGLSLPKVGFGTWGIGGEYAAEPRRDRSSLRALLSAIELGYRHFDTAELYAAGHCEQLLGRALLDSGVDRGNMFVTTKVSPHYLSFEGVLKSCRDSLRRLGCEYVDLYLIHWPDRRRNLEPAFQALNELVQHGEIRSVGVSNFDVALLKEAQRLCDTPIVTNQVPFSLHDRKYSANGVLEYCRANSILLTSYSPLEQGRLRPSRVLEEMASARSATSFQMALAWICSQPGVIAIPMSTNPLHQRENLEAADIVLTSQELNRLAD